VRDEGVQDTSDDEVKLFQLAQPFPSAAAAAQPHGFFFQSLMTIDE